MSESNKRQNCNDKLCKNNQKGKLILFNTHFLHIFDMEFYFRKFFNMTAAMFVVYIFAHICRVQLC